MKLLITDNSLGPVETKAIHLKKLHISTLGLEETKICINRTSIENKVTHLCRSDIHNKIIYCKQQCFTQEYNSAS